jgi:8-oxo-dGTP pyrophosphatase MutT (NUDIX family)
MTQPSKRRRGTAIVETEQGILVINEGLSSGVLLPGGGAEAGESRLQAAVRELREETGLESYLVLPLFRYSSAYNDHTVYFIKANGAPELKPEINYLGYYRDGSLTPLAYQPGYEEASTADLSTATRAIIQLYYEYRAEHSHLFAALDAYSSLQFKAYS